LNILATALTDYEIPAFAQGCSGNESVCRGACPAQPARTGYFLIVETQKMEPDMHYRDSIPVSLLKPICRRRFRAIVESHNGNAYDKSFGSWDHLIALIHAQLNSANSLRGLETGWNARAG
jgi:hypothetical protein